MMDHPVHKKPDKDSEQTYRLMPTLESPEHCRAYAGFLLADNLPDKAAVYYRRAADAYIGQGQVLKALAVNLAMWRFQPPLSDEIRRISQGLKQPDAQKHPVIQFLSQLDESQLASLFSHMASEKLSAAHTIIKPGQIYDYFYINVSGTLKDSMFMSVQDAQKNYRSPTIEILENEYFGEIYPFDKEIPSHSYIETLSPVEVIKISKESLRKLCARFSHFEVALLKLFKVRQIADNMDVLSLRRTKRLKLGVELDMMIEMVSDGGRPIQLKGYTQDISVDGICTVLDNNSCTHLKARHISEEIVGETIKIAAGLKYLKVFFSGKIAWWKFISHDGQKTIALGIQLNMLPPNYKGILMSFLNLMRGEEDKGRKTNSAERLPG